MIISIFFFFTDIYNHKLEATNCRAPLPSIKKHCLVLPEESEKKSVCVRRDWRYGPAVPECFCLQKKDKDRPSGGEVGMKYAASKWHYVSLCFMSVQTHPNESLTNKCFVPAISHD